jgi:FtsP/CotA-like multicopper oxidase with cupredoxin domain
MLGRSNVCLQNQSEAQSKYGSWRTHPVVGHIQSTFIWYVKQTATFPASAKLRQVDFQIIGRSGGERSKVLPYEEVALKDVVWLNRGETVRVLARYAPWDGLYMFHCKYMLLSGRSRGNLS